MIQRPFVPPRMHPVYTGDYYIQTTSIDDLLNEITNWIDCRNPGGIIYGRARIGKTRAIHKLSIAIKEMYGEDIAIVNALMSEHKPNEKFFYLELLKDIGHSLAKSYRSVTDLKSNLINHLITLCKSNKLGQLILFINEANFLSMDEYNYLIDIYNRLEREKLRMTVLLVGTKEIISTKTALIQMNKQQIIERFMIREYNFRGIVNKQDLQICLASYDYSEYPENSGWSFTRYFFPESFSDGHKLCEFADQLFEYFSELVGKSLTEIPMQYVTSTIENCLRKYGSEGYNVYLPTKENWMQSIEDSGYVKSENLFSGFTSF